MADQTDPAKIIAKANADLRKTYRLYQQHLKTGKTTPKQAGLLRGDLFKLERQLSPFFPWASEAGQDRWVDRHLNRQTNGVFVEVGAHDGQTGSNTWTLEHMRGWRGLLIEPSPHFAALCRKNRTTPCLSAAAGGSAGTADFFEVTEGYHQMSGLTAHYNTDMMDQVQADPRFKGQTITVPIRPLADMLTDAGITQADYISLDVEGAELDVLSAFPFTEIPVRIWSVENRDIVPEIDQIMTQAGYRRATRIGVDDMWVQTT